MTHEDVSFMKAYAEEFSAIWPKVAGRGVLLHLLVTLKITDKVRRGSTLTLK